MKSINNRTAPRREECQNIKEYFDEILDDRIKELILEPGRVCLELIPE